MSSPKIIRERISDAYGLDHQRALVAIRMLATLDLPWLEERAVLLARRNGASWGEIGRCLRRSRQAIHQRYAAIDGTPPPLLPLPAGDLDRYAAIWRDFHADRRRREEFVALGDGDAVPW